MAKLYKSDVFDMIDSFDLDVSYDYDWLTISSLGNEFNRNTFADLLYTGSTGFYEHNFNLDKPIFADELPDLEVRDADTPDQDISFGETVDQFYRYGDTFTIDIDIRNTGDASAGSSIAAIYFDANGDGTLDASERLDTNPTRSLSAGRTDTNETLEFVIPDTADLGTNAVIILLDYQDDVTESDEDNNSFAFFINVQERPDLVVEDIDIPGGESNLEFFEVLPDPYQRGDSLTVEFDVDNESGGYSEATEVAAYMLVNGVSTEVGRVNVSELDADDRQNNIRLDLTIPEGVELGERLILLRVDPDDDVDEADEDNNDFAFAVNVVGSVDTVREGTDTEANLTTSGTWVEGKIDDEPISGDGVVSDNDGGFVDKDWYQVTLESGRLYLFEGESLSLTTGRIAIALYDSSGNRISGIYATNDNYESGTSPSFEFDTSDQSNGTQTYYLAVSASDTNNSDFLTATGDFQIRYTDQGEIVTDTVREGTDTTAFINEGTNWTEGRIDDEPISGDGETSDNDGGFVDKDWFEISLGDDTIYIFEAESLSLTTGRVAIALYDAAGNRVTDIYNGNPNFSSGEAPFFTVETASLTDGGGTYYLAISASDTNGSDFRTATGDYRLRYNEAGQPSDFTINGSAFTVNEGDGSLIITVSRTNSVFAESIYVSTVQDIGSSNRGDYSGLNTVAYQFEAGASELQIEIDITDDVLPESDEQFSFWVQRDETDPYGTFEDSATFTIVDDDTGAQSVSYNLTSNLTSVNEGNNTLTFTVTRSGGDLAANTIFITTLYGSASARGRDYQGGIIDQVLTFEAGSETATFTIDIFEDYVHEGNEYFDVMIAAGIDDGRSDALDITRITIIDDDASVAPAAPTVTQGSGGNSNGSLGSGTNVFTGRSVTFDTDNDVTVSVFVAGQPNAVSTSVVSPTGGVVSLDISGGGSGSSYVHVERISNSRFDSIVDEKAQEIAESLSEGTIDVAEIARAIESIRLIAADFGTDIPPNVYEGLFEGVIKHLDSGLIRAAGRYLDFGFRLSHIAQSQNPKLEFFVEFVDFLYSLSAGFAGSILGGALGSFLGPLGVIGGFAIGNVVGGVIYDFNPLGPSISDIVKDWHRDYWNNLNGNSQSNSQIAYNVTSIETNGLDISHLIIDAEYYTLHYPESVQAINEGLASNLLSYHIKWGILAGNLPNENAVILDATEIDFDFDSYDAASYGSVEAFYAEVGLFVGDTLSAEEQELAQYISDQRSGQTALNINSELSTLANRIARDWMLNNAEIALTVQDGGDPTSWVDNLSTGEDIETAFAELGWQNLTLGSSITIAGLMSRATSAQEVYDLFLTSDAGQAFLENPNNQSIGIGEYAGLWIITLTTQTLQNDATVSSNPALVTQYGSNNADVIFAGTGHAIAHLGDGADTFFGGDYDDVAYGDDGIDTLWGGAGTDILYGNLGDDVLHGGAGNDYLWGGKGDDELRGDAGADTYVIMADAGNDRIIGFENGIDRIEYGDGPYSLSSLSITQVGNDVVIKSANGLLTLVDINISEIDASDFVFRLYPGTGDSSDKPEVSDPVISEVLDTPKDQIIPVMEVLDVKPGIIPVSEPLDLWDEFGITEDQYSAFLTALEGLTHFDNIRFESNEFGEWGQFAEHGLLDWYDFY